MQRAHISVQAITTIMGMQSKIKEKLEHTGQNHAEWQEATATDSTAHAQSCSAWEAVRAHACAPLITLLC